MTSTDEARMYDEFKNYKIYGKILIDDCRNLQDLLGALVCPISAELISYFKKLTSMTVWW
jgi:hypothetical protein